MKIKKAFILGIALAVSLAVGVKNDQAADPRPPQPGGILKAQDPRPPQPGG